MPSRRRLSTFNDWLAGKLSRVTSTGELIPEIDGLRFIAIAIVILHHMVSILLPASRRVTGAHTPEQWFAAADQFSPWILAAYSGHFGVNLFFAISGFILALPFARKIFNRLPAPGLKSYYLRRLTRIEPPYAICLTIYFVALVFQSGNFTYHFSHFLASLLYSHNLIYGEHSLINVVTWSLEIEIQFYLLVPLLVRIFMLRNKLIRRAFLIAMIVLGGWVSQHVIYPMGNSRLELTLLCYLHYFLVGFLLADLYLTGWLRAKKYLFFDLLTVASGFAIGSVLTKYGQYYYSLPVLVILLYIGFFRGWLSNALIRLRWTVIIGGMCYTFYLYHISIISGVSWTLKFLFSQQRPFTADFIIQCLIVLPLVFAACSFWFVLTEKPFMRWSLSPRPTRPEAEVSTTD